MKNLESVAKFTGNVASKSAVGLARIATTDHFGFSRAISEMPKMGFRDSAKYILTLILISIFGYVLTAIWILLLIGYGRRY